MLVVHQGTSIEQDARFSNKEKELMAKMKFPAEFGTKVSCVSGVAREKATSAWLVLVKRHFCHIVSGLSGTSCVNLHTLLQRHNCL